MEFLIQNLTAEVVQIENLHIVVNKVTKHLSAYIDPSKTSLTLVFVNTEKMQDLNRTYRKKDSVTDVLSFTSTPEELGELVFCLNKLREQAQDNKHSLESEFIYLLIHGVLHLCGYEHEDDPISAKRMFKIQDDAFAVLNTTTVSLF